MNPYIDKIAPTHDKMSCDDTNAYNARYKEDDFGGCYRCTLIKAALSNVPKGWIIDVADKVRLELAKTYQDNVDNDVSRMYGNLDWMRLEGAVYVVQELKNFTKDNK